MEVEEQWFKAILIPSLRILEKLSNWDTPDDVNLIIWALDFIFFFLSFCLSSPTIDVDFIDCKKKSRAAVAIERRWREITLLGNKIFHDAIGATTQKKPLYWHFILFELIVIYILHLPLVLCIDSFEMNFITGIFNEVLCEGMKFVCRFLIQGLKFESFFRMNWFWIL